LTLLSPKLTENLMNEMLLAKLMVLGAERFVVEPVFHGG